MPNGEILLDQRILHNGGVAQVQPAFSVSRILQELFLVGPLFPWRLGGAMVLGELV